MSRWCQLSILTDEVSQDLAQVVRFAREFGLEGIELRSLFGKAFRDLTSAEIREIGRVVAGEGLRISGVATPVFKCALEDPAAIAEHVELFRRAVASARMLDCTVVRVFAFLRPETPVTAEHLARAAAPFAELVTIAEANGVIVGVENEASCLVGSGAEMAKFLSHSPASPALGVVWDPCNVLYLPGTQDPVAEEYPLVRARVVHVHAKDARRGASGEAALECVELGTGGVNFPSQFSRLKADGYHGWITLETHWRGEGKLDAESQHLPAGHAFSAGAEAASRICTGHLQRLVEQA